MTTGRFLIDGATRCTGQRVERFVLSTWLGQRQAKAAVNRRPEGPSDAERAAGQAVGAAEVSNAQGRPLRSRLQTPEDLEG